MSINELSAVFLLLIVLQFKHFFADFPLQTPFMLKKSNPGWDFLAPLVMHSGVHSIGTLALVLIVNPSLWWLFIVDFIAHFLMDRVKSGPRYLGQFNDESSHSYWIVFGVDQLFHHLTNYFILWSILTTPGSSIMGISLYFIQ